MSTNIILLWHKKTKVIFIIFTDIPWHYYGYCHEKLIMYNHNIYKELIRHNNVINPYLNKCNILLDKYLYGLKNFNALLKDDFIHWHLQIRRICDRKQRLKRFTIFFFCQLNTSGSNCWQCDFSFFHVIFLIIFCSHLISQHHYLFFLVFSYFNYLFILIFISSFFPFGGFPFGHLLLFIFIFVLPQLKMKSFIFGFCLFILFISFHFVCNL